MTARELTNKEKREYDRMVKGAKQMTLKDLLPKKETHRTENKEEHKAQDQRRK